MTNTLYFGDNFTIMSDMLSSASVDLIYLDPPFNSKREHIIKSKDPKNIGDSAEVTAFEDAWIFDEAANLLYDDIVTGGGPGSEVLQSFRSILKTEPLLAYLTMMTPRLMKLKEILKPTGSIYLHCDPSASHYLKVLMDSIFGRNNFRNEIIWHYGLGAFNSNKDFPRKHDVILRYSKSNSYYFNKQRGEITPAMDAKYCHTDDNGRYMISYKKKYYLKGGKPHDTVWEIPALSPKDKERLGWPTQKPLALLERIILTSCPDGGTVLDPFCGCGTSMAAASKLNFNSVGIDISMTAISIIQKRMDDAGYVYTTDGIPADMEAVRYLASVDKYGFQAFMLNKVGAYQTRKKGADGGIDGVITFVNPQGLPEKMICSVKGGGVKPEQVAALSGVVTKEHAAFGLFITLELPTTAMRKEAASSGVCKYNNESYQRIQIITAEEIMSGKQPNYPKIRNQILPNQVFQRTL